MNVTGMFLGRELRVELTKQPGSTPASFHGELVSEGRCLMRVYLVIDLVSVTTYFEDVAVYAQGENFQEALNKLAVKLDAIRQWAVDPLREK